MTDHKELIEVLETTVTESRYTESRYLTSSRLGVMFTPKT